MSKDNTTVLCIDDEEMIRLSISDYLEDSGYIVYQAENGKVGLEMFREKHPDIVLVDLRMPEIEGLLFNSQKYLIRSLPQGKLRAEPVWGCSSCITWLLSGLAARSHVKVSQEKE